MPIYIIYLIFKNDVQNTSKFFFLTGVYILAWVNVGSAILYAFMFLLVKYEKYGIYAVISGAEITAIMTFSTAMCGFQAGFHLCLIGLCVLVYFSGYFSGYSPASRRRHASSIAA